MAKHIYYDPEADILYILLRDGPVEDTIEVVEDVFIELDEKGSVIGIEIWRASKNVLEPIAQVIAARIRQLLRAEQ